MAKGAFQTFGFSPKLLESIKSIGYSLPTPIQRKCFPSILAGRDVVAMSRTGSGKTVGFALPMIQRLGCTHSKIVGIRGLVLSPTRELAVQTYRVICKLSSRTDMIISVLTGGSSLDKQFESLSGNPDIVVATPGRLHHHIIEAELSLLAVKILVFDEADRLFETCLIEQIENIIEATSKDRQLVLVSATIPTTLASFSKAKLTDPEVINVDSDYILSETLKLTFLFVREDERLASLLFLIRNTIPSNERVIIFCATRHHVDYIAKVLQASSIKVSYIYGNMDQEARTMHLNSFRRNKTKALIVTDIAARGIDIPTIKFVINFDYPLSPKLFVHRTGRTARAGQDGTAFSLITSRDLPYTLDLCLFLGLKMTTVYHLSQQISIMNANHSIEENLGYNNGKIVSQESEFSNNICNKNTTFILASFPDLSFEIESIERILTKDAEIERSRRSMESAHSLYLKTRTPSSKESLRRSKLLLDECGGVSKILMTVHPDLSNFEENIGKQFELSNFRNDPLLNHLKSFRPTNNKTYTRMENLLQNNCNLGKVVLRSAIKMERIKELSKITKSFLNGNTNDIYDENLYPFPEDFKTITNDFNLTQKFHKKRKPKKQSNKINPQKQFFIPYKNSEEDILKTKALQIENKSFDIEPDEEAEIRKLRFVRKWNSVKKKYEVIDKSRHNSIKKTNESGVKVRGELKNMGRYKKWKANTNLKIQKVGEIEERQACKYKKKKMNRNADEQPIEKPNIFDIQSHIQDKHKGILESIKRGLKLTHKQRRIAERIGLIGKERFNSKKKNNYDEIKTPQQIIKKRVDNIKKRMKNDPEFRKKQLSKTIQEFKERNLRKVLRKGRPNKSKMLIVRKC